MPVDLDSPPEPPEGLEWTVEQKREQRRKWKVRKERARRLALAQVQKTLEGWKSSFEGTKSKYGGGKTKYFRVGRVVITEEDKREREASPVRRLCDRGKNMRPKTSEGMDLGD